MRPRSYDEDDATANASFPGLSKVVLGSPSQLELAGGAAADSTVRGGRAGAASIAEVESGSEERSGRRSRSGVQPDECKKAIKHYFLEKDLTGEDLDITPFFKEESVEALELLHDFWVLSIKNEPEIKRGGYMNQAQLFQGMVDTNRFWRKQFEDQLEYTKDLAQLRDFLKAFAESFALLADRAQFTPLMGSYLLPFLKHRREWERGLWNFEELVDSTFYFHPPTEPYKCDQVDATCVALTEWTRKINLGGYTRKPAQSGATVAAKAKAALQAVWDHCFLDSSDEGGDEMVVPLHKLYKNDNYKPLVEVYQDDYLGAVFHFALMETDGEQRADREAFNFIMDATDTYMRHIPPEKFNKLSPDPYFYPAWIFQARSWFINDDVVKFLAAAETHFIDLRTGIFKTWPIEAMKEMVEYFKRDDLNTELTLKHKSKLPRVREAARALALLNAHWERKFQEALNAQDAPMMRHLLVQFVDSFSVFQEAADMNGGYTVPMLQLSDLEKDIAEFLVADIKVMGVKGSDDVKPVESEFPFLKRWLRPDQRFQQVFAPMANKAAKDVWELAFVAPGSSVNVISNPLWVNPGVFSGVDATYVDSAFEHTGVSSGWDFRDLIPSPLFPHIQNAYEKYSWGAPLEALEPVPRPGEEVDEETLHCARKLTTSFKHGLMKTAAGQAVQWLNSYLASLETRSDIDLLERLDYRRFKLAIGAVHKLVTFWISTIHFAVQRQDLEYMRAILYDFLHAFAVTGDVEPMKYGFAVPLTALQDGLPVYAELLEQDELLGKTEQSVWSKNNPDWTPSGFKKEAYEAIGASFKICMRGANGRYDAPRGLLPKASAIDNVFGWAPEIDTSMSLVEWARQLANEYFWDDPTAQVLLPMVRRL